MSIAKGTKRGPYKPKILKFKHVCEKCSATYNSADVKGKICFDCKKKIDVECACGCGRIFKRAKWNSKNNCYYQNHNKRGKTYKEIYGTDTPGCGFKSGSENIMSNPYYVDKLKESIKKSYTPELREIRRQAKLKQLDNGIIYGKILYSNNRNENFRSKLELDFAEFLYQSNIPYEYESYSIKLVENEYGYKRKVPDFTINNIIIEITGLAYENWITQFKQKIKILKQSTAQKIIIITYPDKVDKILDLEDSRTYVINYFEISEKIPILIK